jgi:hypothetical protein
MPDNVLYRPTPISTARYFNDTISIKATYTGFGMEFAILAKRARLRLTIPVRYTKI